MRSPDIVSNELSQFVSITKTSHRFLDGEGGTDIKINYFTFIIATETRQGSIPVFWHIENPLRFLLPECLHFYLMLNSIA